ncbi:PorP/SprF family type IX secretion system membrane protein [Arenibacter sp. GZD96]|uniref:PorP/SprF family type IX secretion system membrane protein n=1 Tax=Aurantibrevibacter litoralis TaxID=3106030 RepID=UPI002AFE87A6|nr:PorP/SprF family type IX secretion system membrane protein [Arenibacter sp. GZD-96]MEA1787352.1 PorP/SprF family type IX secretion system membrane protein [Arenibacter sp. GZD-96]
MKKWISFLFFLVVYCLLNAQETTLPVDIRQHNITEFNASLLNPVFSLDRNTPNSLALWTRWQWQTIDGDPTTTFLNYTHGLTANSAISGGFFQHNTGTFLHTGGILNYAYRFNLGGTTQLAIGLNVFGYTQEFSDDRLLPNPILPLPELQVNNSFIMQFAPGIRLSSNGFGIGLASENLFDYNFSESESVTRSSEKIYIGMMSYDIPLTIGKTLGQTVLQPNVYVKTIPNEETQYGLNALLSTSKFWAQSGYNSFYGISAGAGGRFFKKLSVGALVEFGTSTTVKEKDSSFEFILAYHLKAAPEAAMIVDDISELEQELQKTEADSLALLTKEERIKDKLAAKEARLAEREAKKQAVLEAQQKKEQQRDSLRRSQQEELVLAAAEKEKQQRRLDSINVINEQNAIVKAKEREEKRLDSLQQVQFAEAALKKAEAEKVTATEQKEQPKTAGRYEEVTNGDGLAPGYYLVANVFGTKKYFENFMSTLQSKGLQPKSFYRSVNKYNYVYLERYETLKEAEVARDSQFEGRYPDKTWIFRVIE